MQGRIQEFLKGGGGGGWYTINECHLFMSLVIPEPDTTFAKCTLSFHNLTNSRMVKVK